MRPSSALQTVVQVFCGDFRKLFLANAIGPARRELPPLFPRRRDGADADVDVLAAGGLVAVDGQRVLAGLQSRRGLGAIAISSYSETNPSTLAASTPLR